MQIVKRDHNTCSAHIHILQPAKKPIQIHALTTSLYCSTKNINKTQRNPVLLSKPTEAYQILYKPPCQSSSAVVLEKRASQSITGEGFFQACFWSKTASLKKSFLYYEGIGIAIHCACLTLFVDQLQLTPAVPNYIRCNR